jgi:uncharacterized protein (TIGR02246 family)
MRTTAILSGVVLSAGVICFGADEKVLPKKPAPPGAQPTVKAAPVTAKPAEALPSDNPVSPEQAVAIEEIRLADESFAKAYSSGDAAAVAAHFTTDAEYVDEVGTLFHGRQAIEQTLTEFFAAHPRCTLEMNIDTIRFISPGIAVEDGSTTIIHNEVGTVPVDSRYTTVHVKTDGKWLAASVRDHAPKDRRQHRAELQQLNWLKGNWIDEGDDSIVSFVCQPSDNGNFLIRQFNIQITGREAMSGTQRIGWDPLTGKLRTWMFDSEGAYADGHWHRDGENWVLKTTGTTADGESASSTSIYTLVNEHTMTWQSIDQEIAGVQQPDSEVVTIVRQSPSPSPVQIIATDPK